MNHHPLSLPMLALLAGCSDFKLVDNEEDGYNPNSSCSPVIQVEPQKISFGELKVADRESDSAQITITNNGDCTLNIDDVKIEGDDLAVYTLGLLSTPALEPGMSASIEVTFKPVTDATNEAQLLIYSNDGSTPTSAVDLLGDGIAPKIKVTPTDYDFGILYLGCEVQQPITISNVGRDVLVIDETQFSPTSEDLRYDDYQYLPYTSTVVNGPLPWTLKPGDQLDVYVLYNPLDELADTGYLFVESNDPFTPQVMALQNGNAEIYDENTDTYEQPLQAETDILFAVDKSCSMGDDIASVTANFQAYTSTLEGLNADYRIAVIVMDSGEVFGDVPFIDQYNADDAVDIVTEMLQGPEGGLTEMAFSLLENGVAQNSSWLREDAELHLIGVSDEPEQSTGGTWSEYVEFFQSLKEFPEDVKMHGIGGDVPTGCGSAWPYTGFYEATIETDGLFLSICTEDWASQLQELAEESAASLNIFALTQNPVPETIEVFINDSPVARSTIWHYEKDGNAVIFREDETPEGGSVVDIHYVVQSDCDF